MGQLYERKVDERRWDYTVRGLMMGGRGAGCLSEVWAVCESCQFTVGSNAGSPRI